MKNNTLLRQDSIRKVFSVIRDRGPVSKRQLEEITKFSWGNISSIISLLLSEGYLMINGKQETGLGRKPEFFDINNNNNYIIGVDFNISGVTAVLCDLGGKIVWKTEEIFESLEKDYALDVLFCVIDKVFKTFDGKNILSVAVAMQGEVDTNSGVSVFIDGINGWSNVPIADILREKYGIPALVFHDPDCLLYTEKFFGLIKNTSTENALLIRIDHGVGIGVMYRGNILMSCKGSTCEIENMVISAGENSRPEFVKNVLSIMAVKENYYVLSSRKSSFENIVGFAKSGDKCALEVFGKLGTALGYAVNNASCLLNPEKVFLFGTVAEHSDLFLNKTKDVLNTLMKNPPPIFISKSDKYASAVGATIFAADRFAQNTNFDKID